MKLYLRKKVWWLTYGSNPQKRVSTGQTDKKKAEEIALRYGVPAATEDAAELLERAARLRAKARDEAARIMPLKDAFRMDEYLSRHAVKRSSAERAGYYWGRLVAFCRKRKVDSVEGLSPRIVSRFIASFPPRAAQIASIYCRQILRDAGASPDIVPKPRRTADVAHHDPLTPSQIAAFLSEIDGRKDGAEGAFLARNKELSCIVRLLIYSGLRLGDAATLSCGMVDLGAGTISRTMAKTGREVLFPIHPALMPFLSEAVAASRGGMVFPFWARSYAAESSRYSLSKAIKRALQRAGIEGASGQYCAHCLRATFATLCAEHGVPMAVIQSWLGHTSPMVTRIYARIEDLKRKRDALERLPDFG